MATARLLRSTVFRRTLAVVLLLAAVAAMISGLIGWHANALLTRATERAIETDVSELKFELVARGFDALVQAVAERSHSGGDGVYYLADQSGEKRAGNLPRQPVWLERQGRGLFRYPRQGSAGSVQRTAAGLLIEIDGAPRLIVGRDVEEQRALLWAIYRSVGFGAGLLLLIGLGGSVLIARHVLARVDDIGRVSAEIMSGNLARRVALDGSGDELDRLARRLNEMLARIEQLMASLREVSDNIAHDLKTPLNRLRNRAEAALGDGGGAQAWRGGLEAVIDEADDLIKTFNALLLIARLEAGSTSDGLAPLDLSQVVRDVAELYEPVAEEAGFSLSWRADDVLPVRANRQLLGQALANLIDNALKYAAGGKAGRGITITAEGMGSAAVLTVADRGPGIPPEHRERALKRFVRLQESRSLPGTGLGLSLVAAVARLHGGTIRLADNAPGLKVVVTLPLALAAPDMAQSVFSQPPTMEPARE